MPIISWEDQKNIEVKHNAIAKLQEKCESCKLFRGKVAKDIYCYSIRGEYSTDDGPAMLVIASYDKDTYAIYAPEYLTHEQLDVFEFFLREVEPRDKLIVFSKKSYNAVKEHRCGKSVNVKLVSV